MEFCRTKGGNPNSFKSPDTVNQIDWSRKKEYYDVFEYYRNLIQLRKNHPAFRMTDARQIQEYIHFCTEYKIGVVSYCINGAEVGDSWKNIVMLFNGSKKEVLHPLPDGTFQVVVNGDEFFDENQGEMVSGELKLQAVSMMILIKTED
jgi:pullulanase